MRVVSLVYALLTLLLMAAVGGVLLIYVPGTPLPDAWNPVKPFDIGAPVTPLTDAKLRRALRNGDTCRAALRTGATFTQMDDLVTSAQCGIKDRVKLRALGGASVSPVETRCQTALRLAMWHAHGITPAAERHFNQPVTRIHHASSYNCRAMRTTAGNSGRMSTHATAGSVDITGVTLAHGQRLRLIDGWPASDARAPFFRDLRNSACMWFRVTLGPDYNRLHADHFHLQNAGWGLCR